MRAIAAEGEYALPASVKNANKNTHRTLSHAFLKTVCGFPLRINIDEDTPKYSNVERASHYSAMVLIATTSMFT